MMTIASVTKDNRGEPNTAANAATNNMARDKNTAGVNGAALGSTHNAATAMDTIANLRPFPTLFNIWRKSKRPAKPARMSDVIVHDPPW